MKIAMLLSGGVDSSVALKLLAQEKKHDLTAFYLKIWLEDELSHLGDCPWESDMEFVREVCRDLGIPFQVVPLQQEYLERVVDYAIGELKSGRTPSPDILCNSCIKFSAFYDRIDDSYEKVATGHYAQIQAVNDKFQLKRSPDPVKDQTYFLYRLTQQQLGRVLFPIGHLHKREIRSLAEEFSLPNKDRKDSQGLCFLGKIKYEEFVKHHLGERIGAIIEIDSKKYLGDHLGYWFYTIGQRQGLGLSGGPWYVIKKDITENIIYVSHQEQLNRRSRREFIVSDLHWIAEVPEKTSLKSKIRHGPKLFDCEIIPMGRGDFNVRIAEDEAGIAPGQSAIFYDDDICLGGGIIQ